MGAGQTLTLSLASAGVPANAESATLNLTAVDGTEGSFLTIYPVGEPLTVTSSVNWSDANPVANQVRTRLGTGDAVHIYNLKGIVHVVADRVGYSTTAGVGSDGATGATGAAGLTVRRVTKTQMQTAIAAYYPEMSVLTLAVGKGRDSGSNGAIDALRYNESVYDFEPFGVFATAAP